MTKDERSCYTCVELNRKLNADVPDCSHWEQVPEEIVSKEGWELQSPNYCGNYEPADMGQIRNSIY